MFIFPAVNFLQCNDETKNIEQMRLENHKPQRLLFFLSKDKHLKWLQRTHVTNTKATV